MEIKPVFQLKEKYAVKINPIPKLIGRVKLANFMGMPENNFAYFINKIENNPLFRRLTYPDRKEEIIISYRRLYRADLSKQFCELKEEIIANRDSFDVQQLLSNRREIVETIVKLGMDKFKRYFLYNESNITNEEISALCGLEVDKVENINRLMNEVSIHSEFYHPSKISLAGEVSYFKVASIEKNDSGEFVIAYFSPHHAKGRYLINYEKLKNLKMKGCFSEKEIKKIDKLLKQLEIINSRKTTSHKVIQNIIEYQSDFLKSGKIEKLVPLSQKEIASRININPSLICRAINGRSIHTPWQEEIPLRNFFLSKKDIRKNLIKEIISEEKHPYKDREIKNLLKTRYQIDISSHLVNICRNELRIPSASKRNKQQQL